MPSLREYKEEYALPVNACLNVTNACPLACKYCFVHQNPERMSLEIAQDSVKYLYNNLKRKRELLVNGNLKGTINFFGGEPMLMYDEIIVPLVEWTEKTYPDCFSFGITTNGVLLNKKSIDFFYQHNITPLLSMDGDRETQDYNRPYHNGTGSFDKVVAQIPYLLDKFPNTVFRMTIYEDTSDKFFDNVLFAEKMGFKYFFSCLDSRTTFSEKGFLELQKQWEQYSLYFIGCLKKHIIPIQTSKFNDMLVKTLGLLEGEDLEVDPYNFLGKEIIRCGLGTQTIGIAPNGNIYGCQEHSSTDTDSIFYLGNIYEGIKFNLHLRLLNAYRDLAPIVGEHKECFKCPLRKSCTELECPSASYVKFNNFNIELANNCRFKQILYQISKEILLTKDLDILQYVNFVITRKEIENNGILRFINRN